MLRSMASAEVTDSSTADTAETAETRDFCRSIDDFLSVRDERCGCSGCEALETSLVDDRERLDKAAE